MGFGVLMWVYYDPSDFNQVMGLFSHPPVDDSGWTDQGYVLAQCVSGLSVKQGQSATVPKTGARKGKVTAVGPGPGTAGPVLKAGDLRRLALLSKMRDTPELTSVTEIQEYLVLVG